MSLNDLFIPLYFLIGDLKRTITIITCKDRKIHCNIFLQVTPMNLCQFSFYFLADQHIRLNSFSCFPISLPYAKSLTIGALWLEKNIDCQARLGNRHG